MESICSIHSVTVNDVNGEQNTPSTGLHYKVAMSAHYHNPELQTFRMGSLHSTDSAIVSSHINDVIGGGRGSPPHGAEL